MIVQAIKRGGRGMPIVEDQDDRYRYIQSLYFLNDKNHPRTWKRDVDAIGSGLHFQRPDSWPDERDPYVDILSYCLLDNHHHLLLRESQENGVSDFMKALSSSMTQAYNEKHDSQGSIFQGKLKKRFVETDNYLRVLFIYINIKNTFEMLPGGLKEARDDFDTSFEQALEYSFSSLSDLAGNRASPVVDTSVFDDIFATPKEFKKTAKEQMARYNLYHDSIDPMDDLWI